MNSIAGALAAEVSDKQIDVRSSFLILIDTDKEIAGPEYLEDSMMETFGIGELKTPD